MYPTGRDAAEAVLLGLGLEAGPVCGQALHIARIPSIGSFSAEIPFNIFKRWQAYHQNYQMGHSVLDYRPSLNKYSSDRIVFLFQAVPRGCEAGRGGQEAERVGFLACRAVPGHPQWVEPKVLALCTRGLDGAQSKVLNFVLAIAIWHSWGGQCNAEAAHTYIKLLHIVHCRQALEHSDFVSASVDLSRVGGRGIMLCAVVSDGKGIWMPPQAPGKGTFFKNIY